MRMKSAILFLGIFSLLLPGSLAAQDGAVAKVSSPAVTQRDNPPPPKPYVYGPGDQIAGKVMGEQDYSFEAEVDENGKILLAFAGTPIVAQCKTERELHAEITKVLERDLKNPQLMLRTVKRARPKVTVFGEVNTISSVELTRKATLFEMLAIAGGPSKEAGQVVEVFRPQKVQCSDAEDPDNWKPESGDPSGTPFRVFNLAEMGNGIAAHNPVIMPGDVIHVRSAYPVYIVGEVVAPQGILLKKHGGTTVMEAISMVQGLRPEAKKKDIKIYRKKLGYDQRGEPLTVNLDLVSKGKQNDIFLEPYDLIVVDKAKKSIALTIAEFALGTGRSIISSAASQTGVRVVY